MRKIILGFALVFTLTVTGYGGYLVYKSQQEVKEDVPQAVDISSVIAKNSAQANILSVTKSDEDQYSVFSQQSQAHVDTVQKFETNLEIPPSLNLKASFYSQAPHGNWDYPWQEACEEASVLLVANAYYNHSWSKEDFNREILNLVEWEKKHFGSYEHTDIDQTAKILNDYLQLRTVIHDNPTYEDVQKILAKGHLIVTTFSGKELKNPFYSNGGPIYHAMMIKGYKEGEKIITHDVGTKRGENYVYPWKTIEQTMHDYAEPIQNGKKRIIEILPPSDL